MSSIRLELIQQLRQMTGVGMLDCKKALEETQGNLEKAVDVLRKKGASVAAKRADKDTQEGIIHSYIHASRVGVLIEINCETDFVARTDDLKALAQDLCLHIAALKPSYVSPEHIDEAFLTKERTFAQEQLATSQKPQAIIEQIIEGKIKKLQQEVCLLEQPFVKNDKITVAQRVQEVIAKLGENIKVRRFVRYEIGSH